MGRSPIARAACVMVADIFESCHRSASAEVPLTWRRAVPFPAPAFESLERRALLAANFLVSGNGVISEYTPAGQFVRSVTVPTPEGSDGGDDARDLVVTEDGKVHVYNGTFDPFLSTYNPLAPEAGRWTHNTFEFWHTINNVSYGGIATHDGQIYVADMASGIVRFDPANGYAVTHAERRQSYIDLTASPDGKLYALINAFGELDVYDAATLQYERSIELATPQYDVRALAVDASGDIFGVTWGGTLFRCNSNGAFEGQRPTNLGSLLDIDIHPAGTLLVGGWFGGVGVSDVGLDSFTHLTGVPQDFEHFITFGTLDPVATSTITASVAHDVDRDGQRNGGDLPLAGRTVFIDLNGDFLYTPEKDLAAMSDASGAVAFPNLTPGTYRMAQLLPAGWRQSAPLNGFAEVTISGGGTISAGDFLSTPFAPSPHLDPAFGSGGAVLIGAPNDTLFDQVYGVARLADGKVLVGGSLGGQFRFIRYNANGTPDISFGANGPVTPTLPAGFGVGFEMVVGADGKIYLGGQRYNPQAPAVLRFNANGTSDTSFGTGGAALLSGFDGQSVAGLAIDNLGRVVIVGNTVGADVAVARLTASGQTDTSFDGDGRATYSLDGYDHTWAVAIQSDRKILFVGETLATGGPGSSAYVMRLTEAGAPDATFGGAGGIAKTTFTAGPSDIQGRWTDLAILPDGRIAVAGLGAYGFAAARYTALGQLDPTFGSGTGKAVHYFTRTDTLVQASGYAEHLDVLADGTMYLTGHADVTAPYSRDMAVLRLRPDGSPDASFAEVGRATAALGTSGERILDAVLDPATGKLIVAGYSSNFPGDVRGLLAQFKGPRLGYIAGFVYNDTDADGVRDVNETSYLGRTIWLDTDNDGVLDTGERSTTSPTGDSFIFFDVPPGTYNVRASIPTGWRQTSPANNAAYVYSVAPGQTGAIFIGQTNVPLPPPPNPQTPYHGTPFLIGSSTVTIEAEHFDKGGEGVAYHDTDSSNGGAAFRTTEGVDLKLVSGSNYRVNNTFADEWMKYSVNVPAEGTYDVTFRVSSKGSSGQFHLDIPDAGTAGPVHLGSFTMPMTGSNDAWTTITKRVFLSNGQYSLRLYMDANSTYGSVGNFDWIRLTPVSVTPPPPPPGDAVTLNNSIAAYVRDGASAGTNFGNDAQLVVKLSNSTGNRREAYLKFDVSALPTDPAAITNVKLRLNGRLTTSGTGVNVAAFGASNTSWNESSINWNTKPATSGSALATKTITGTTAAWHEWDITNYVKQARQNGQSFVTLVLRATNITDPQAVFNSDDAASNGPQLIAATTSGGTTTPPQQRLVVSHAESGAGVPENGFEPVTVALAAAPASDVTVTIAKQGGGDADITADKTTLTFTPSNWNVPQQVNLSAADDADTTDGEATFAFASSGLPTINVIATEQDDDVLMPPPGGTIATDTATYVRGGAYAGQNFGTASDIIVKRANSSDNTREAYLKFDLSNVSTISSAKLRLHARLSDSGNASLTMQVFSATSTSWTETGLTWNNKPASSTTVRGSVTVTGTTAQWYEIDLTSFLQAELAAGRRTVTLVLKNATASNAQTVIRSDESADGPQLLVA